MTVLITGGAGYIGSHTVYDLVESGEQVVVLDDLSTGLRDSLPDPDMLTIGDVGDQNLVAAVIRRHQVDSIVHFAGSIVVPESVLDPLKYYRNNTVNSRALIETAIGTGVKNFIFSSTAAVYGEPEQVPVPEDAAIHPVSPYGWSKYMTEVMLRDAERAHGLRHMILRYFNVAGADAALRTGQSTPNATHLIKVAVQASLGLHDALQVFGTDYSTPDGTCIRDYIHVSDLARAHRLALHALREGRPSATLNCGYGRGHSVKEVIAAVERATEQKLVVHHVGRRAGDPASLVAKADKIRAELGWQPQFDNLDLIVKHALAWERLLIGKQKNGIA